MISHAKRNAGAVGQATAAMPDLRLGLNPALALNFVERHVLIGAGKVRHQQINIEPRDHLVSQRVHRQAKPIDAAIDHQVAKSAACCKPKLGLMEGIDHWLGPGGTRISSVRCVEWTMQYRDRSRRNRAEQIGNFEPMRDKEIARAGRPQHRDGNGSAQSIGVGLDRGPGARLTRKPVQRGPVAGQRRAIDL